ncbi:MAG: glycosyltransferase family 2 protein [Phascolarctobacterium sp.]|nr:glycosyltransferase family 2 protein [Candidatus Phascolarctobacterium caballi]
MDKILTIVIPSYNTSKFVDTNIKTVLSSKFLDSLDILFVNDGSKDNTAEIIQKYVEKYPQSIRIINKGNGGHGSTINVGIIAALGKYFRVLDGDDYVDTNALDNVVGNLQNIDVDLCISPFVKVGSVTGNKTLVLPANPLFLEQYNKIPRGKVLAVEEYADILKCHLHTNIFRTALMKEHPEIHMTEHTFYEDTQYYLFPMPFVKKFMLFDEPVYQYLTEQVSQSCSIENIKKRMGEHKSIMFSLVRYYENVYPKEGAISRFGRRHIAGHILYQFHMYLNFDDSCKQRSEELKAFDKQLFAISKDIYLESGKFIEIYILRKIGYWTYGVMRWIRKDKGIIYFVMRRLYRFVRKIK